MSVWEGWVLEREPDTFTAEVTEVLPGIDGDRVVMEINLDMLSEQDRALCEPGAIFDMAIEDRCLSIAFRTDVWTAEEIEEIKARAHERWQRDAAVRRLARLEFLSSDAARTFYDSGDAKVSRLG